MKREEAQRGMEVECLGRIVGDAGTHGEAVAVDFNPRIAEIAPATVPLSRVAHVRSFERAIGAAGARERAIRAVVAAQWAVACALFCVPPWTASTPFVVSHPTDAERFWKKTVGRVAALPCAVDIVDGAA